MKESLLFCTQKYQVDTCFCTQKYRLSQWTEREHYLKWHQTLSIIPVVQTLTGKLYIAADFCISLLHTT